MPAPGHGPALPRPVGGRGGRAARQRGMAAAAGGRARAGVGWTCRTTPPRSVGTVSRWLGTRRRCYEPGPAAVPGGNRGGSGCGPAGCGQGQSSQRPGDWEHESEAVREAPACARRPTTETATRGCRAQLTRSAEGRRPGVGVGRLWGEAPRKLSRRPPEVAALGHLRGGWGAPCARGRVPDEAVGGRGHCPRRAELSSSPGPAPLKTLFALYLALNFRCSGIRK